MTTSYIAFWADQKMLDRIASLDWNDEEQTDKFFGSLEKQKNSLFFGQDTDGWVMSSVLGYLEEVLDMPEFGSALGTELFQVCDYISCVLPSEGRKSLGKRMEVLTPHTDPKFPKSVYFFFQELGKDYKGYVDDFNNDPSPWYELYDDLKDSFKASRNDTLVIMIPF